MTDTKKPDGVFGKLSKAREIFHGHQLKKTGRNEFARYDYFELSDFLPQALKAFRETGIIGVVSFATDLAFLTITDIDDGSEITISSPLSEANLKGMHPIQNLGAVQSYLRRYLWAAALELIEGDVIDKGHSPPTSEAPPAKPAAPKPERPTKPVTGQATWDGVIGDIEQYDGLAKASGKPYSRYTVILVDGRKASTFDKAVAELNPGDTVKVTVKDGFREGYYDVIDVELVDPADSTGDKPLPQDPEDGVGWEELIKD